MITNIKSVFLIVIFQLAFLSVDGKPFFMMINPAGHAKSVGRRLIEDYERSITFKMAEVLKQKLQDQYGIRCVLTRYPGEEIVDLQNASFANRLGIDFYLSLHIYRQEFVKPKVFVYSLVYNPMVDLVSRIFDPYLFVPVNQAHFFNISLTQFYGLKIKDILTKRHYKKSFDFYGIFGIPIKPLVGIVSPALSVEIGICDQDQWKNLINPIVDSLYFLGNGELL